MNEEEQQALLELEEFELSEEARTFVIKIDKNTTRTFLYDHSEMTADQQFRAETQFRTAQKLSEVPPADFTQMKEAISRASEMNAIANLILEKDGDGNIIPWNSDKPVGIEAMRLIKGKPVKKLKKCQDHFLFEAGITTGLYPNQLMDSIQEFEEMGMSRETAGMILAASMGGVDTEQLINMAKSSIEKDMIKNKSEQPLQKV